MTHIKMPVSRLSADDIWTSFRASGKRHIVITGTRGRGKTTLLSRLFPVPQPGLTSWAVHRQGIYLKDNGSGASIQVGVYDPSLPGLENRMVLQNDGFLSFGIPALQSYKNAPGEWVTIDEIGYLECTCPDFHAALYSLMEHKHLAAVVRKQKLPFLQKLCARGDVFLIDLDAPFQNTGCVIMASGLGVRFGGNKLMADFLGEPMILRAIAATAGLFHRTVVVTRHEEIAHLCRQLEVEAILHALPHRNDTIRLGLEALGNVDCCLFCPGDQPLLTRQTIARLLCGWLTKPEAIWRPTYQDTPGSPVLFPAWTFPQLLTLPTEAGGGTLIRRYPESVQSISISDPWELTDADTPQMLEHLKEIACYDKENRKASDHLLHHDSGHGHGTSL